VARIDSTPEHFTVVSIDIHPILLKLAASCNPYISARMCPPIISRRSKTRNRKQQLEVPVKKLRGS
jgi:hypothetical protein